MRDKTAVVLIAGGTHIAAALVEMVPYRLSICRDLVHGPIRPKGKGKAPKDWDRRI